MTLEQIKRQILAQRQGRDIEPLPTLAIQPLQSNQKSELLSNLPGDPNPDNSFREIDPALQEKLQNNLRQLPDIANGLGSLLEQISITENGQSNPTQSAIGSALKGGSAGASLGPLGIIGGALLGGASGFASANQSNADFYDQKALNESFNLSSKTVSPSILGKGGFVEGDDLIPVQMELDEMYVTPDLEILDSKAKMKHEKMKDSDITDIVKPESFVFSNRKKFKPSTNADELLGYGFAYYNEDGDFDLEEVKMKDIFGDSKKEITYSEGIGMVKKSFKTVRSDDKNADLFTRITNNENKQARLPFINNLIKLHENKSIKGDDAFIPQKFEGGGVVRKKKVKKYRLGGNIDSLYEEIFGELEELEEENVNNLGETTRNTNALFDRLNTRNGVSSLINGLSTALQSTRVDPQLQDTRFADQIFEEFSPALADQVGNEGIARANSLVANVAKSNPRAAQNIAPRLFDSALRQSNSSRLNILNKNIQQRRGKFSFLNKTGTSNRNARIQADEATRNLINKKRRNLANVGTNFLRNRNKLDINQFEIGRQAQGQFNKNRFRLLQNNLDATGQQGNFNLQRNEIEQSLQRLQEFLQNQQFKEYTDQVGDSPIFDLPNSDFDAFTNDLGTLS